MCQNFITDYQVNLSFRLQWYSDMSCLDRNHENAKYVPQYVSSNIIHFSNPSFLKNKRSVAIGTESHIFALYYNGQTYVLYLLV